MDLLFYHNSDIDKKKWDEEIKNSYSGLLYARSDYLDFMSPGWAALIHKASGACMPLTMRKKLGIPYCFQPPFTQQLGVFSREPIEPSLLEVFLQNAAARSKIVDVHLNYANSVAAAAPRTNYILDLSDTFENVSAGFRQDLLPKHSDGQIHVQESTVPEVTRLYRELVWPRNKSISPAQMEAFEKLAIHLTARSEAFAVTASTAAGTVVSAALFFRDDRRIYYIMSANTTEGRQVSGNAALLYEVIRKFSGSGLIFDFEGSEIPGVRFFFEKFSPVNQPYYHFTFSRLNRIERTLLAIKRRWL